MEAHPQFRGNRIYVRLDDEYLWIPGDSYDPSGGSDRYYRKFLRDKKIDILLDE